MLDATYTAFVKSVAKKPYPTLNAHSISLLDEVAAKMPNAKSAKPDAVQSIFLCCSSWKRKGSLPRWRSATRDLALVDNSRGDERSMNPKIGQHFPDIELPDQDGQQVKLSKLAWASFHLFFLSIAATGEGKCRGAVAHTMSNFKRSCAISYCKARGS